MRVDSALDASGADFWRSAPLSLIGPPLAEATVSYGDGSGDGNNSNRWSALPHVHNDPQLAPTISLSERIRECVRQPFGSNERERRGCAAGGGGLDLQLLQLEPVPVRGRDAADAGGGGHRASRGRQKSLPQHRTRLSYSYSHRSAPGGDGGCGGHHCTSLTYSSEFELRSPGQSETEAPLSNAATSSGVLTQPSLQLEEFQKLCPIEDLNLSSGFASGDARAKQKDRHVEVLSLSASRVEADTVDSGAALEPEQVHLQDVGLGPSDRMLRSRARSVDRLRELESLTLSMSERRRALAPCAGHSPCPLGLRHW